MSRIEFNWAGCESGGNIKVDIIGPREFIEQIDWGEVEKGVKILEIVSKAGRRKLTETVIRNKYAEWKQGWGYNKQVVRRDIEKTNKSIEEVDVKKAGDDVIKTDVSDTRVINANEVKKIVDDISIGKKKSSKKVIKESSKTIQTTLF